MTVTPQSTLTPTVPVPVATSYPWRRNALIVGVVAVLIAATYIYAWFNASSLATQYLHDADSSYNAGKYLDALVGTETFDQASNTYVTHGGYLQVQKIFADSFAWPKPSGVERADARINEIINQRITVDDAEQFIQANTGKKNPYFGVIYLRLGELYEQKGDKSDAKDVYSSIPDLFADNPDLVAKAKANLARLNGK